MTTDIVIDELKKKLKQVERERDVYLAVLEGIEVRDIPGIVESGPVLGKLVGIGIAGAYKALIKERDDLLLKVEMYEKQEIMDIGTFKKQ